MSLLWLVLLAIAMGALALSSFVQLLYLESLRLRSRESRALETFKEDIAPGIGLENDEAATIFSLYKHALLVIIGALAMMVHDDGRSQWLDLLQGFATALASMAVFSYLVPQILYRRSSAAVLRFQVPLLRLLALLIKPLASLLNFFLAIAEISKPAESLEEGVSPEEEIDAFIAAGEEEGLIEEGDKKLIQSVVAFGDKRVREVMTPRPNIVAIEGKKKIEELRRLMIHEKFSRIPVMDTSLDEITGFVHVRDLFEVEGEGRKDLKVIDIARPIAFVPETKLVQDLLREMQHDGNHMAIVVDEYGNTAGLATMEDLVEEVFGEIRDEHEPGSDYTKEGDGSFVIAGSYDLDHLKELVEFEAENGLEATTVGGLATEWFGRVPQAGEVLERNGIWMEILASDERRVEQVRLKRLPEKEAEDDGETTKEEA